MSANFTFDQTLITHIAELAKIPVDKAEVTSLTQAFNETLEIINSLQALDVKGVKPSHHTTDLTNVLRPDRVNTAGMFTQDQALANAKETYQGYFVVPQVIKNKKA